MNQIIKRMIAASGRTSGGPAMTHMEGSFATALNKTARRVLGVEATLSDRVLSVRPLADITSDLSSPALLSVLSDADGTLRGLFSIDALFVNALVEYQTGAGNERPYLIERIPTPVDAALSKRFIDALLGLLSDELTLSAGMPLLGTLFFKSYETQPKLLADHLDVPEYISFSAMVNFGDGARAGRFTLALPPSAFANGEGTEQATGANWTQDLHDNVLAAPLKLNVVLLRQVMTLSRAMALAPGDLIRVPATAMKELSLEGADQKTVLTGRLGQMNGDRAVRVSLPVTDKPAPAPAPAPDAPHMLPNLEPLSENDGPTANPE